MGEVWRGRDLRLGRPVAVKVLHGAQADPHFRTRFRNEAQHAARLSHPNIATVFDYGEETAEEGDEPTPFLVMELVEGQSLADLLGGVTSDRLTREKASAKDSSLRSAHSRRRRGDSTLARA